jgi:hypothetical protein
MTARARTGWLARKWLKAHANLLINFLVNHVESDTLSVASQVPLEHRERRLKIHKVTKLSQNVAVVKLRIEIAQRGIRTGSTKVLPTPQSLSGNLTVKRQVCR